MMEKEKQHIGIHQEPEPSSFRLIMTLGIAGFLSGLLLVSIYLYTKPIIAKNKQQALEKAVYEVLPGAVDFQVLIYQNGQLKLLQKEENVQGQENEEAEKIYLGMDANGNAIGFALPGQEPGFQDIIGVIFGFRPEEAIVIGFEVLESKETPGLGDKIYKDEEFIANFTALKVEPEIEAVPSGEKEAANEVATITGATISSKAVVRLLNKTLDTWKPRIQEYLAAHKISWSNESYE